jgi:hypothetical protein
MLGNQDLVVDVLWGDFMGGESVFVVGKRD